jgi:hypothetical protein
MQVLTKSMIIDILTQLGGRTLYVELVSKLERRLGTHKIRQKIVDFLQNLADTGVVSIKTDPVTWVKSINLNKEA